jgi:hypothetical protein
MVRQPVKVEVNHIYSSYESGFSMSICGLRAFEMGNAALWLERKSVGSSLAYKKMAPQVGLPDHSNYRGFG